MTKQEFTALFLSIIKHEPSHFKFPSAAQVVKRAVQHYADCEHIPYEDAVVAMSDWPDYGDGNDRVGGVNVYVHEDGRRDVEFTFSSDSTWMSLERMVHAVEHGVDDWFDEEWATLVDDQ